VGADVVQYQVADLVATVTLDSPGNRNALSPALVSQLEKALAAAAGDAGVRALVLTHTGTTFCAGADLRAALETAAGTAAGADHEAAAAGPTGRQQAGPAPFSRLLVGLLRALVAHPKPVVAQVNGHVRAGGLGLVAACDLAVAGPSSTFAFTESRLGLAPAVISLVTTPRLTSRAASRYYLTGETFDSEQAQHCGLVTVAADDPAAATTELLDAWRLCSPQGLAESKRVANAALLASIDADGERLAAESARLFGSPEAREGMAAFAQRRPPWWAVRGGDPA